MRLRTFEARKCIRPTTIGNAVGESLAQQFRQQTPNPLYSLTNRNGPDFGSAVGEFQKPDYRIASEGALRLPLIGNDTNAIAVAGATQENLLSGPGETANNGNPSQGGYYTDGDLREAGLKGSSASFIGIRLRTGANQQIGLSSNVTESKPRFSDAAFTAEQERLLANKSQEFVKIAPNGVASAISPYESFLTFNPLGQTLRGNSKAIIALIRSPLTLLEGVDNVLTDAANNTSDYLFGQKTTVFGDPISYSPTSALGRSLESNGVLGTFGDLSSSIFKSTPGIAQVGALYTRNYEEFGASLPGTGLILGGNIAISRAASFYRTIPSEFSNFSLGGSGASAGLDFGSISARRSNSAAAFADEAKLTSHFEKHGAEFGAKSSAEYLQIGRDIIQYGQKVEYLYKGETRTGFVQFMNNTSKGDARFGFVGTNSDGSITTIFAPSGKNFFKAINKSGSDKTIRTVP